MAKQFSKTKLAAAVGAAAFGAGVAAPAGAVVVVGGNDGWEVSFDGNVNAFYTVGDYDQGYFLNTVDKDNSRVHTGFLPAFFSFNVKSPTVNGMTATARISFAPTINNGGPKTQFSSQGGAINGSAVGPVSGINGATIDTREVVVNLSGAFGEVSFGRTLSLFGRNAILNDMTLFGVGFAPGPDQFGSVTFGRVGHGYTYPDFSARFQYTTPVVNGFQAAIGMYDPSTVSFGVTQYGGNGALVNGQQGGFLDETDTPRFEMELSYSTSYEGGSAKVWMDGLWQEIDSSCRAVNVQTATGALRENCGKATAEAWGIGTKLSYMGFEAVGYYHENQGLGLTAQFTGWGFYQDANNTVQERDGDGFYVQGTYTFGGKTKVGVSYGEGNMDSISDSGAIADWATGGGAMNHVERSLWTVGVYHDVTSWLKLIAEYNHGEVDLNNGGRTPESDTLSVGGFMFW